MSVYIVKNSKSYLMTINRPYMLGPGRYRYVILGLDEPLPALKR